MGISLPDARQLSDEVLEALRLRALRGCEMGLTESEVASLLGVSRETVSRWWTAYCGGGVDGLPGGRTGRPLGSGRTLTDEQGEHIQGLIDGNSPEDLGIAAPLWSRDAVRQLIHKEYGLWMPVRTVGEYLRRWGYTAKRPSRHAKRQDPQEVQGWIEETYPQIEAFARQEDGDIQFCDETGAQADHHPRRGYSRRGQPASLDVPDSHLRINLISTINNDGDLYFLTYKGTMTGERFVKSLEGLIHGATRKIFLVADRHPAHDSEVVAQWLDNHFDQIELVFLPRYSPELNPVEYLNNDLKGNLHSAGLPNTKKELHDRVHTYLSKLLGLPGRVMNYFLHPHVQYAAQEPVLLAL